MLFFVINSLHGESVWGYLILKHRGIYFQNVILFSNVDDCKCYIFAWNTACWLVIWEPDPRESSAIPLFVQLLGPANNKGNTKAPHYWSIARGFTFDWWFPSQRYRQATSHYLNECWPRFLPPYGVTRPQWINILMWWTSLKSFLP